MEHSRQSPQTLTESATAKRKVCAIKLPIETIIVAIPNQRAFSPKIAARKYDSQPTKTLIIKAVLVFRGYLSGCLLENIMEHSRQSPQTLTESATAKRKEFL